jgi:hypothetical protein
LDAEALTDARFERVDGQVLETVGHHPVMFRHNGHRRKQSA